eukprot:TRINITY_DN2541_c0_g1_i1.p1 TRINITY_DN2541_c0_g1~~TRINITY_DN2541_c0_g1_i1.p1  ORF type:complete len:251 (-),score=54.57 TRINITY_DN2541_c0_g1_i1:87-737(-)
MLACCCAPQKEDTVTVLASVAVLPKGLKKTTSKELEPPAEEQEHDDDKFVVEVENPSNSSGLDVVVSKSKTLLIAFVAAGSVDDWNGSRASEEPRVREGDQIVEVNGVRDAEDMVTALADKTLRIHVKPRQEWEMVVEKGGEKLGVELNVRKERSSLLVNKIFQGPVTRWNDVNPHMQLRIMDQITEVNGVRGDGKLLYEQVKVAETIVAKFVSFQ